VPKGLKRYTSLVQAIASHAQHFPQKTCLIEGDVTISYLKYWEIIERIAVFLEDYGLRPGDRVVVQSSDSIPITASGLGIQLAGGIFVPVEKTISEKDLISILAATESKILIGSEVPPQGWRGTYIPIQDAMTLQSKADFKTRRFPMPEESSIAEILYTTGTTGERKGVVLNHRNVVAVAENIKYGVEMKPDNVELLPVSLTHSYGLRSYYASMLNGSTTVFLGGVGAMSQFFTAIEKHGVTSLALVPAIISMILKISGEKIGQYRNQLDYVQSGSSALTEEAKETLCRLLPDSRLYNFYGSTEAGRCCLLDYNKERGKISCIGKPAYNASFKIVDDDLNEIRPSKENVGLLVCLGAMNMQCYWNDPDGTARTLKNGAIYTSDLAYMEDGYVYYAGRKGDIINSGGIKIIPAEIEKVALQSGIISECICTAEEDELLGQVPCLWVVMKEGSIFSENTIKVYLSGNLGPNYMPKIVREIDKIPRTFNGKPDRKALKAICSDN
jgi:acyl-CoA synthetase (AMP-forming)/AMP-acid ligase II